MREALINTIETVPYNSIAKLFVKADLHYPHQFGGNCIEQVSRLAEKLRSSGYEVRFLRGVEKKGFVHYAILCSDGKSIYYLDPFLMQLEPINIKKALQTTETIASVALPFSKDGSSRIILTPEEMQTFRVTLYGETTVSDFGEIHSYSYDLAEALDSLPSLTDPGFHKPQKLLFMRVLNERREVITITLNHQTGFIDIGFLRKGEKRIRMDRETRTFFCELEKITKLLHVRVDQLINFLYQGHALYVNTFTPQLIYSTII